MPGPLSRAWLLSEAHAQGLLSPVHAVIVTANVQPERIERPPGVRVFQKRVDMDVFLATIRRLMDPDDPSQGQR